VGGALTESAAVTRPAIISPLIDALCVGGLSLLLLLPLLLSGRSDLVIVGLGMQAWIAALVNMPHFMASYRLIYRSRETIDAHRWAAIYVPLLLIAYIAFAVWRSQETDLYVSILMTVQGAYLAWHYTGQAWGMMAAYSWLEGVRFDPLERLLLRASLRIMLAWHVSWFLNFWLSRTEVATLPELAASLYQIATYAVVLAVLLGAGGMLRMYVRIGRFPPLKAVVAWLAIFVWYAAVWRWGLPGFFLVQLAHALQYLEFPARVELNRATRKAAARTVAHMALYAVALLVAAFLVILAVPGPAMSLVANFLGATPNKAAAALVLYFINIHHYFTDGVVWKLSNPEVRKELFAHVVPPALTPAPAPSPAGAAGAAVRGRPPDTRKPKPRNR